MRPCMREQSAGLTGRSLMRTSTSPSPGVGACWGCTCTTGPNNLGETKCPCLGLPSAPCMFQHCNHRTPGAARWTCKPLKLAESQLASSMRMGWELFGVPADAVTVMLRCVRPAALQGRTPT